MPGLWKSAKSFVSGVLLGENFTVSTDSQIYKLICVFDELDSNEEEISVEEKTKYLENLLDAAWFWKIDECWADIFWKELWFWSNISPLEMSELLSYLEDIEIAIIVESFWLYNFPKKSLRDLCTELGVSGSYIALRKERAIKTLKKNYKMGIN